MLKLRNIATNPTLLGVKFIDSIFFIQITFSVRDTNSTNFSISNITTAALTATTYFGRHF